MSGDVPSMAPDDALEPPTPAVTTADRCMVLESVDSTNTQARKQLCEPILADASAFPLYVLLANEQTGGRGRLGRTWVSGHGTSFLSSFVARIPTALATGACSGWLTTIAGIDAVEALRAIAKRHGADPRHIGLKWPNDVYWDGLKLGGILTELAAVHAGLGDDAVVIFGIGINLFLDERPTAIATSLHRHVPGLPAYPVLRNELAQLIAQRLRQDLHTYCADGAASIAMFRQCAEALSCTLGRRVSVELPDGTRITGVAQGIRSNAALEIRVDDRAGNAGSAGDTANSSGTVVAVTAGDVGLIPQAVPEQGSVPPHAAAQAAAPAHSLRFA
ncbi:MAG: biotin--[acetyl-CoA-carboxylase] ligase [Bifidobacteriaceae bacterium]|nr:biotin--[acetyl-CoA-carboxylase] ligase [Bifidobacteriaceae bacterium]